jgi:hypothetical protein
MNKSKGGLGHERCNGRFLREIGCAAGVTLSLGVAFQIIVWYERYRLIIRKISVSDAVNSGCDFDLNKGFSYRSIVPIRLQHPELSTILRDLKLSPGFRFASQEMNISLFKPIPHL